jgi:hypothetical protein
VLGLGLFDFVAGADGRRTVRDLAFALGRGLYETMLQLARMRAGNMVVITPPGKEAPSPARSVTLALGAEDDDRTATGLPRRRKDRPGSQRTADAGRKNLTAIRMLWPRSEGNAMPGGA